MAAADIWGNIGNALGQKANWSNQTTQNQARMLSGGGSSSSSTSSSSSSSGSSGSSGGGGSRSSGGSSGGSVSSSAWGCPSGATLVREPGSSNLVCRWNHNGALFAAQPKSQVGSSAAGSPAPEAAPATTTAPEQTQQWLQSAGQIMARDPQAMLAVQMQDKYGDSGGNALYGMLTPYADAANALYLMQRGTDASHGSVDDNLAWLDDYWTALQTPGARIDTGTALNNMFNAGADSPLHSYLSTGDPSQQANRALSLIAGGVETGMSPIMAQSIMDRLRLERDRYLGESARGGATGSFIDYLRSTGIDAGQLMGVR